MSAENVEALRRAYDGVNRRDFAPARRIAADELEVHSVFFPGRVFRGPAGIETLYDEIGEGLEDYSQEPEELIDAGDDVVALVRVTGVGKESGVQVSQPAATVWTFRDGKLVKGVGYTDRAEALRAVGLE